MSPSSFLSILHGYHLDGSGSCVYVANTARSFAKMGQNVILICQEPRPEKYDFISQGFEYDESGQLLPLFDRSNHLAGKVIYVRPYLENKLLPVYVKGPFPGFDNVKSFPELTNSELESYINYNVHAISDLYQRYQYTVCYANHIVMMPYLAYLSKKQQPDLRYFLIPHGSEIEYLIKDHKKFFNYAIDSLTHAEGIVSGSDEMTRRIDNLFGTKYNFQNKYTKITVGVDPDIFGTPKNETIQSTVTKLKSAIQTQLDSSSGKIDNVSDNFLSEIEEIDFENGKSIINFGRLISGKGVQDLILIAPYLLKEEPHLNLFITGDGPAKNCFKELVSTIQSGDQEQFKKLINSLENKDIAAEDSPIRYINGFFRSTSIDDYLEFSSSFSWKKHIHFPGYLKHDALSCLLALSSVAVFPSIVKEAYPLALLEAMATGVFPIASDYGGLQDGLAQQDGVLETAKLKLMRIPMNEDRRLLVMKENILQALDFVDSNVKEKLAKNIRTRCSWDTVCNQLSALFHPQAAVA